MSYFFSVIVPTHNRPRTLALLLESLSSQELSSDMFEILVIPSPQDLSLDKFNHINNMRMLLPDQDPYNGTSASYKRNYGAQSAKGTWFAFTDDDCLPDKAWLKNALEYIQQNKSVCAIEGLVNVPKQDKLTLTYKGMLRLSKPGGFQTCNMFYRKEEFNKIGGFDLAFPYYLEDTDLGWSFLDAGLEIPFVEGCIVTHPVEPPNPKKLLTMASRSGQHLRLRAKHRERYAKSTMLPMRFSHWVYIGLTLSCFIIPLIGIPLTLLVLSLHMVKLFWKLSFTMKELTLVFALTPFAAWTSLFHLVKMFFSSKARPTLSR